MINTNRTKLKLTCFAVASSLFLVGQASKAAGADALGQSLTAAGAEKSGSSNGTIPAFEGAPSANGWTYGKYRLDYYKYKDEKPLVVIDASNVDKYAKNLTPGQIELIKKTSGYSMPIYPTHRDCGTPDAVAENTKANVGKAAIAKDGWSLDQAILPGVPFPQPASGIEAVWNFLTHYQGVGVDWPAGHTVVTAKAGSSDRITIGWKQTLYFPWAADGQHGVKPNGLLSGLFYGYTDPAALAGQAAMARNYFKDDSDSFYYFTGQRRVRRLPNYSYDAPLIGFENQYPYDEQFLYSGNPDRYNWKIVGKKEVYIPYNEFGMYNFNRKIEDVVQDRFVTPDARRYELHRVWEVQGDLKADVRHSMPKRVLYIDEDSWIAAVGDDYDAQGQVWKTKESFVAPSFEVNACIAPNLAMYDLTSGRLVVDGVSFGTGKDIKIYKETTDSRLRENYYTPENLSAISER